MEHSQDTMTVLPIKLRSSEKERLKKIGLVKKRSPHWLIKEAIHQYWNRKNWQKSSNRKPLIDGKSIVRIMNQFQTIKSWPGLTRGVKITKKRLHYENQVASWG